MRRDLALRANRIETEGLGYSQDKVWKVQYRPFVKQHCYVDYALAQRKYQQDSIFPSPDTDKPGSLRTRDRVAKTVRRAHGRRDARPPPRGGCVPSRFPRVAASSRRRRDAAGAQGDLLDAAAGLTCIDNITDTALRAFRVHYNDNTITRDAIFDYVYGVLHAPAYRERFANDLAKELPRVPFAPEFHTFATAGRRLAELHLGYEHGEEWPLDVVFAQAGGKAGAGALPDRRTHDALRR